MNKKYEFIFQITDRNKIEIGFAIIKDDENSNIIARKEFDLIEKFDECDLYKMFEIDYKIPYIITILTDEDNEDAQVILNCFIGKLAEKTKNIGL